MSGGVDAAVEALGNILNTRIMPNLASEFAFWGISKLGELIGVPPMVSQLIGSGIRTALPSVFSSNPQDMFGDVMKGLAQGVVSVGLNYATQASGLDPLLANIGFSAIASGINAGLQAGLPDGEKDIFKAIRDTYESNVLHFLGDDTDDPWAQQVYRSQITDFAKITKEQGLVAALNSYATGFFSSVAVQAIVQSGVTIGTYFKTRLDAISQEQKEAEISVVDESTGEEIETGKFKRNIYDEWELVGKGWEYFEGVGKVGVDAQGRIGFYDQSEIDQVFGRYSIKQTVNGCEQTYVEVTDWDGNLVLIVEPTQDGGHNYYGSYGEYVDAKITDYLTGRKYGFTEKLGQFSYSAPTRLTQKDFADLFDIPVLAGNNSNLDLSFNISDNNNIAVSLGESHTDLPPKKWTP